MSLLELVCALTALVPGLVAAALLHRRAVARVDRPPIPIVATGAAASLALVAVPIGVVLGFVSFPGLVAHAVPTAGVVFLTGVEDSFLAPARLGVALGAALALPGLAALGALLLARDRSVGFALRLALAVASGAIAGGLVGALVLAPRAVEWLLGSDAVQLGYLGYGDLAGFLAGTILGPALAGAILAGVATAGSRSREGLRVALAWTAAVPGLALAAAAPLTPPDLVSQLALALVLGAAWSTGLIVAGVVRLVRRSRSPTTRVA